MNKYENEYNAWRVNGSKVTRSSVPEAVKWYLLIDYAERYGLTTLVETGTAVADTILHVHEYFNDIFSFELMETYYDVARRNVKDLDNVWLINESSASEHFFELIKLLKHPTLFYLDAHYSGLGTGQDANLQTPDVPVREELEMILAIDVPNVVIIDDARAFRGEAFHSEEYAQYPSMEEIADLVKGRYTVTHVADAFILEPS